MLKISNIEKVYNRSFDITYDYYVPCSIDSLEEGKKYAKENLVYWELTDENEYMTLMEIGVGENTGEIKNITLTEASIYATSALSAIPRKYIEGNPIIDLESNEHGKFVVEQIKVYLSERKLEILLNFESCIESIINVSNELQIGINEKQEIIYFAINDIKQEDYQMLKDSMTYSI